MCCWNGISANEYWDGIINRICEFLFTNNIDFMQHFLLNEFSVVDISVWEI